tara:strand:- start:3016 stop:3558 length:543 start_codon:yes stop_codon:yes gene_type:complete
MALRVVDNFLPKAAFRELVELSKQFTYRFREGVSAYVGEQSEPWNSYGTHLLYNNDVPQSPFFENIYNIFGPAFNNEEVFTVFIRVKANLYPHTETLREHQPHIDYPFKHVAGVFSLNTCDGFTRMQDGSKIDSVANRMVFFDGSVTHNSSTTTNASARYNINFNLHRYHSGNNKFRRVS